MKMSTELNRNKARDMAIEWARVITAMNFAVADTETTGLDADAGIVSLGLVSGDEQVLLNRRFNPGKPIEPGATRTHHITDEMVKDEPPFSSVLDELKAAIEGRCVVVYNYTFDAPRINRQVGEAVLPVPAERCAMEAFASFCGEWSNYHGNYRWQKLTTATQYLNLDWPETGEAHDAATDALMTVRVITAMAQALTSDEKSFFLNYSHPARILASNRAWQRAGLSIKRRNGSIIYTDAQWVRNNTRVRLTRQLNGETRYTYVNPSTMLQVVASRR